MTYQQICRDAGIEEFKNTENIIASIIKAIKQKAMIKVCGPSGSGKTKAIQAVSKKISQMCIVTVYAGMTRKELLEELALKIGVKVVGKTIKEIMRDIKKELNRAKKVICIDEANFLHEVSLEQLRHIHDMCECTMILVGTERLEYIIARSHPQVDSRIRESLPIKRFGIAEVKVLAQRMKIELDDKQATRLWKRCRNFREIEYWLQDFIEMYTGNMEYFDQHFEATTW